MDVIKRCVRYADFPDTTNGCIGFKQFPDDERAVRPFIPIKKIVTGNSICTNRFPRKNE